jgi:hypothetical protein
MENTKSNKKPVTSAIQKEMLKRIIEMSGDEDVANNLMRQVEEAIDSFSVESSNLLQKHLSSLKEKLFKISDPIDQTKRVDVVNAVSLNAVDGFVDTMIGEAAIIATATQMKLSRFMFIAGDTFENEMTNMAYTRMAQMYMDSLLQSSPAAKPEVSKEKLS